MSAKVTSAVQRQVDEYSIRWDNGDWLVAHVSDVTGVLSICSTWGSWSHRWNVMQLPTLNLTSFLSGRPHDLDYFAKKLVPLERQSVVDVRATRHEMRRQLCSQRRRQLIAADDARDCWFEIEECGGAWVPHGIDPSAVQKVYTQEWLDLTERALPVLLATIAKETT